MAWAEKTFFNVEEVSADEIPENENDINRMLKNLPPFMKMTSRRARKVLVRYEAMKERQIENLRDNQVFKFVMKVAGFTNERVEKFWKGSDISPFMEKYKPKNIKITKEDLNILILRAREHALSDLHQFCTDLSAIPMYRPAMTDNGIKDRDPSVNIPEHSALPDPESVSDDGYMSSQVNIYNMSDSEFYVFCKKFLLMKKTLAKAYDERNGIKWYLLTDALNDPAYIPHVYDHTEYFNIKEEQVSSYDLASHDNKDINKPDDNSLNNFWTWMDNTPIVHWDKTTAEFWFQRYIAKWLAGDSKSRGVGEQFRDLESFRVRFRSLFNNLRLDKTTGKWIRDLTGLRLTKMIRGRTKYKDRAIGFKSLDAIGEEQPDGSIAPPTRIQRTPSQLSKGSKVPVGVTKFEKAEEEEGDKDMERPGDMPTEVPLDFVRPIFNERFAHWKHELVLGEYEKRSMQEADRWLQMTPWAIGKIYLQPSIYAHMQEAHIAIARKFKKFAHLSLEDWLNSDEHSYFFSKLVALCIKTSEVLSGKKYGLDKMYMRINLEKRRIMYAIGKLETPTRQRRVHVNTIRPSASRERTLRDWSDARLRGDTDLAASIQARLQRTPF